MNEEIKKLYEIATDIANKNKCCKYSKYTVGAALLTKDNKVYKGFNVENDGIQSICAERSAFINALVDGALDFKCIIVEGKKIEESLFSKTLPCGYCRQFIREYTDNDFKIYSYDEKENKLYEYKITDLLPESFKL